MSPVSVPLGETARQADSEASRAGIPPDESSLINIVAKADLSPQTRTALLALAEAMQRASVLGRARPRTQPWVERD